MYKKIEFLTTSTISNFSFQQQPGYKSSSCLQMVLSLLSSLNIPAPGFLRMPKYYRSCREGGGRSSEHSTLESLSELEEMREI